MDPDAAKDIGALGARLESLSDRLSDHVVKEEAFQANLMKEIGDIRRVLFEATGAKKMFVWLLGLIIAAIALAKGWVLGK